MGTIHLTIQRTAIPHLVKSPVEQSESSFNLETLSTKYIDWLAVVAANEKRINTVDVEIFTHLGHASCYTIAEVTAEQVCL